jgi:hypothetical protein
VFKRVLDFNFEEGIISKIRYQLKNSFHNSNLKDYIFEMGGGAVLLL